METLPEEWNNTNLINRMFEQSNGVARNDTKVEIDAEPFQEEILACKVDLLAKPREMIRSRANTRNILPICSQNLTKTQPIKQAFGFMAFSSSILYSVFHISPHCHYALLIVGLSIIRYRAEILTTQFVLKLGNSYKARESPLSFGESLTEFFPQITDMTMITLCYLLILWLVCPLHSVLQIFIVLMLITAPCYYIPELVGMASGVAVTCGSFKLSIIWFIAFGALVLSLIFIFLTLQLIYFIQRYIHPGEPRVKELHVSLDALSEILTPLN